MRIVRVKWLGPCPECGCKKLSVLTNSERDNFFNDDEVVSCDKCGNEGVLLSNSDEHAYVDWNQKPNGDRARLTGTLKQLVTESNMMSVQNAVVSVYNRCSGPDSVHLHKALAIISTLREMKEKGVEL